MKYPAYEKTRKTGVDWLPAAPAHWKSKRLKFTVELVGERVDAATSSLPFVGLEHIESWTGRRFYDDASASESLVSCFQTGDVLFGKLRPYLAKVYLAEEEGTCTGEMLVLRTENELMPAYLRYFLASPAFIGNINSSSYGTKMPRANWEFIGNQLQLLPPLDEQCTIVAFLNEQTARLDALLARQQLLLRLLAEQRTALITQAVTQGLDADAPRRPSGVAWLGEVPAHWEVKRLRYLIESIKGGGTPATQNAEFWDGPLPWVSPKDMKATYIDKTQDYVTELALQHSAIELITPGCVLIVVRSGILKHTFPASINSVPVTINQDLKALMPNVNVEAKFLLYLLKAYEREILSFCSKIGATVDSIEIEDLLNFVVVLPPRTEQRKISSQLDNQISRLSKVEKAIKNAITKLQEYRAAIITAAVTGQIDVRATVAVEAA